jgi:hypothetical protein
LFFKHRRNFRCDFVHAEIRLADLIGSDYLRFSSILNFTDLLSFPMISKFHL